MRKASEYLGPQELLRLKRQYLIPCGYHFYQDPPQLVWGQGCWLTDQQGKRYLDCYSGVTVNNAGHCQPELIEPVVLQLCTLQHTTSIYLTEPVLRLAAQLATITPPGLTRSFFCASGTEAVEGALLTAALHTGRPGVIALSNGLHGRTRWAMSVTGLPMWRTDPFPIGGVTHVPFGDLAALEHVLAVKAGEIAAFVAEPIQGNGGIQVPDDTYWPNVRKLCDAYGVLLIFDEIQTGYNRTGRWFSSEHWNVRPDIMAISKGMGNGLPIAAFITTDEIAASYTRPGASTYGGNPVCAAAALAVIEFHRKHGLGARAQRMGDLLMSRLRAISCEHPGLQAPRGKGLMIGLPIVDSECAACAATCDRYLEALKDLGVLAGKTGPDRNVLTFMPPLIISEEEVAMICDALVRVLREAAG